MEIRFTHYFDADVKTFDKITSNPEFEELLMKLPNVAERETIKCKETKRYIEREVRYFAVGFIPPVVRPYLKPKMLTWFEKSIYNKQKHFFEWEITPHYFREYFECKGTTSYIDDGKNRMRRETDGHLKISIPVIGAIAEKMIIENLAKNMEKEYKMTSKLLRKKLAKMR